jgi:hypothetical protein
MYLVIDLARIVVNVGWISLFLVLFIIGYRLLLRNMKKGLVDQEPFVELSALESDKASGDIQFFLKLQTPKHVHFSVYGKSSDFKLVLKDQELDKGGHVVNLKSTDLENGWYYYEVKTDNQKITKLMEVEN